MKRARQLLLCGALLCSLSLVAQAATKKEKADSAKPTIPVFTLSGTIPELPADDTFSLSLEPQTSFKDLTARMLKAGKDEHVKAIVILWNSATLGGAQTEELRQVLAKLREEGKEIYAYTDQVGSLKEYAFLSGATQISLPPTADLWITGLYTETPYLHGLLSLLGVKPDFLSCGEYKSAAEIFMREGPSPAAEKMQNWLLDSLFENYSEAIAKGRGVDADKVKGWINGGPYTAEKAKEAGIIDQVEHRDEFSDRLREKFGKNIVFNHRYGKKKPPTIDLGNPFAAFQILNEMMTETQTRKKSKKDAIGIVYVAGAIALGGHEESPFGEQSAHSTAVRKALDKAADDDTIKAVVLRIDSPGGSAVASEIILAATRRVKAKKPFVVSMGDVAGSGGYYVACAADTIFADASTITGSIGVVGGKFATTDMWSKVGIKFHSYERGENASMLSARKTFSPEERERMQKWMDEIYGVFKQHVIDIRGKKLKKPIDELAGGRVYTGKQALELGLVDKIGTMQDAIALAAEQAKITDYEVRIVPEPKNFLEKILEESSGVPEEPQHVDLKAARAPRSASIVELALPYLQHLDPQRVSIVKHALRRMQLMQQEGVLLMMPELGM